MSISMRNLHLKARLERSLKQRGVAGSLRHYAVRAYRIVRPQKLKPHPFDLKYGVHTNAYIEGSELGTGHEHDIYNVCYYPSPPSVIQGSIEAWQSSLLPSDPPVSDFTCFDLGAGMGRAVMVASFFPFKKVIGIEMNAGLTEEAHRNFAIWLKTPRACNDLDVVTSDATEYPWPNAPLMIYMFNPFEEPVVLRLLASLDKAMERGAGPIDIVYIHPLQGSAVERHPKARLIKTTICYLSKEDGDADLFSPKDGAAPRYECRIYRLSLHPEPQPAG